MSSLDRVSQTGSSLLEARPVRADQRKRAILLGVQLKFCSLLGALLVPTGADEVDEHSGHILFKANLMALARRDVITLLHVEEHQETLVLGPEARHAAMATPFKRFYRGNVDDILSAMRTPCFPRAALAEGP